MIQTSLNSIFHFHSFQFSFIILLSKRDLLVSLVHCIRQVYEHSYPLFVSLLIFISFNFFPFSMSMLFIVLELALSNRESYIFVVNQRKWQASPNYQVQFSIFQFSWLFIQFQKENKDHILWRHYRVHSHPPHSSHCTIILHLQQSHY